MIYSFYSWFCSQWTTTCLHLPECVYLGVKVSVWWGPTSSPDHSCWSLRSPRADVVVETHYCYLTAGLSHCCNSRLWPHWAHCLRPSGPLWHSRKSHLHELNSLLLRNSLGRRCPMFRPRAILIVYTKMRKKLISVIIPPCCCHLSCANWELQLLIMLFYSLLHLDVQCVSLALPVGSEDDRMAPGSWEKNWTILLWMQSTW